MKRTLVNVVFVLGLLVHYSIGKLYDGFTVCKVKESKFESCLNNAIESGVKLMKNGLPEYKLQPLDPFHVDSMTVGAGSGAVNLVQNYNDVTLSGFTDININYSHIDFDKKVLRFTAISPLLEQKAQYTINGKILMLPVHGTGSCSLTLENAVSDHVIEFEEVKKQGEIYYSPKSYTVKINAQHASYHFDNLFDGNKLLGDNINKLINDEWYTIFLDVQDGYEKSFAQYFLDYVKNVFDKAPIKEIFIQ